MSAAAQPIPNSPPPPPPGYGPVSVAGGSATPPPAPPPGYGPVSVAKTSAPSTAPVTGYSTLTDNPKGEGVYPMVNNAGQTVQIPYGNVQEAAAQGHRFQTKDALQQYARDHAADPVSEDATDRYVDGMSWYNPVKIARDLSTGFATGVLKTGTGLDHAPQGHGAAGKLEQDAQLQAATPTKGAAGAAGEAAENVGEWFTGEELLGMLGKAGDAMGIADKLKSVSGLAQTIEKYPLVGKLLKIGSNAVKQGTIGAGQTYAKTGDAGQAAEAGGLTAVAAPVMEGLASKVTGARAAATAAAEPKPDVGTLVSSKLDDLLNEIGPQLSKEETGKAVGKAVDQINQHAVTMANEAYNPLKEPLGLPANATRQDILEAAQKAGQPQASSILDANGNATTTPGDGGKALADLKTADAAYGESRGTVNRALVQKIAAPGSKPELAYRYIQQASMDDMQTVLGKLDEPTRQGVARNVLQDVVNAGGEPENFKANAALKAYRALDKDGEKSTLLFGDNAGKIRDNLQSIADMTDSPAKRVEFGQAVRQVATNLAHGAIVGGVAGEAMGGNYKAGAALGTALVGATYVSKVMRAVIANPKIGGFLTSAIRMGARPEVYGPMIAKMVQEANDQEGQQ